MQDPAKLDRRVTLAFLGIVLLLGLNFVAVRFSNRELPPFWGAGARFLVAAAILLTIARVRAIALPRGRALAGALLYGALAFGLTYALVYWGMVHAPAGLAGVSFALVPLVTLAIAVGVGQERLRARPLLGALLAVAGIAAVFRQQLQLDVPAASMLAVLAAVATAAASGVVVKRFPRSHPVATNAVGMGVGAFLLLAASVVASEPLTLPRAWGTRAAFVWLVGSSCGAFVLMVWLLARRPASSVAYTGVLSPLVAIAGGALLAGESVTLAFLGGAILTLAGAWLGTSTPSAAPANAPTTARVADATPPRTSRARGAPGDARTSSARPRRAR